MDDDSRSKSKPKQIDSEPSQDDFTAEIERALNRAIEKSGIRLPSKRRRPNRKRTLEATEKKPVPKYDPTQTMFAFDDGEARSEQTAPAPITQDGRGRIQRNVDGWWIVGLADVCDCGPYVTRAEADGDLRGMRKALAEMGGGR